MSSSFVVALEIPITNISVKSKTIFDSHLELLRAVTMSNCYRSFVVLFLKGLVSITISPVMPTLVKVCFTICTMTLHGGTPIQSRKTQKNCVISAFCIYV